MKNPISFKKVLYSFLFFVVLTTNFVQSQTKNTNTIVGSWIFNNEASFSNLDKKASDFMDENPELKLQIQASYSGKLITFLANGVYSQTLGNGIKSSGNWEIKENSMLIKAPDGTVFKYSFKLSNTSLLLTTPQEQGKSISIVPNQYFTKI